MHKVDRYNVAERPEAFEMFERGTIEQRVIHDAERMEQRRTEREHEALAQRYAIYAQATRTRDLRAVRDHHEAIGE